MGGMYNVLFGTEGPQNRGGALLPLLGFSRYSDVGRYRDSWVERGEDGEPVIAIYTRNGGGNRECWEPEKCDGKCTGCMATKVLPAHPSYLRDRDDSFDSTYATFYFRAPEEVRDALAEVMQEPVDMSQVWQEAIDQIGKAK